MRFADIRGRAFKRTAPDEYNQYAGIATPQRLSPFEPDGHTVRREVHSGDVYWPTYNRVSRRASGQVKPRKRIRGSIPPHPVAVINAAHRIERDLELQAHRRRDAIARKLRVPIEFIDETGNLIDASK